MSNIYIYSKGEFVNLPLTELNDKAIIRIYNSRDFQWKDSSEHYKTIIELFFDDIQLYQLKWHEKLAIKFPSLSFITNLLKGDDNSVLFSNENAQEIIKFIKKNKEKDFVIQCEYGKSRSISVALFMKKFAKGNIINKDKEEITHYNEFVYNILKKNLKG